MDSFELELAFYDRLLGLVRSDFYTMKPHEAVESPDVAPQLHLRRGFIISPRPRTAGFGNGIYTRARGIYQITLDVLWRTDDSLEVLKKASDAHLNQFFPTNNRGLTVTSGGTSAHIDRRPAQRYLGRQGAYLRELVEVPFYVEIQTGV